MHGAETITIVSNNVGVELDFVSKSFHSTLFIFCLDNDYYTFVGIILAHYITILLNLSQRKVICVGLSSNVRSGSGSSMGSFQGK